MTIFRQLIKDKKEPESHGPDKFPIFTEDSNRELHLLLSEYQDELLAAKFGNDVPPNAQSRLEALPPERKITLIHACLDRMEWLWNFDVWNLGANLRYEVLRTLLGRLMETKLPFSEADIMSFLHKADVFSRFYHYFALDGLVQAVATYKETAKLSDKLVHSLLSFRRTLNPAYKIQLDTKEKLDTILFANLVAGLEPGDAWSDHLLDAIGPLTSADDAPLFELLDFALTATASTASNKWLAEARRKIGNLGEKRFKRSIQELFPLVGQVGDRERRFSAIGWSGGGIVEDGDGDSFFAKPLSDQNCDVLKGLVWCCALFSDPEITTLVAEVAAACFRKIPGYGARSKKVGNACLFVLGEIGTPDAVAHLGNLQRKTKLQTVRKLVAKAADHAARKAGTSRDELEELALPTYGFDAAGETRHDIGGHVAVLRLVEPYKVEVRWELPGGKLQKSLPESIKNDKAVKDLKRTVRDIETKLVAERDRLETLFLSKRTWTYATWRERYLDHPLRARLARRLVWQIGEGSAIEHGGQLVDCDGNPLGDIEPDAPVGLWHPLLSPAETVGAWRSWLEREGVTQPFKQAHREVYVLTDAERQTATYSNRFAAHVLNQHQFAALCRQRGWRYDLQGRFDSHNVPRCEVPEWNLAVEFWVDGGLVSEETSEMGIYLHVATDQVRFIGEGIATLADVPPIVFSELMRDVDLFVGVASIGNDPMWRDRGDHRHFNYWEEYSFGALRESGKHRRDLLERLVPRLKIADRCSFDGNFLVVRGDLRTYRIHLGSGNIQMEPDSRYLCIVGMPGKFGPPLLPFEGDGPLSLILSKAFLLAADTKITDPSIVNQIRHG